MWKLKEINFRLINVAYLIFAIINFMPLVYGIFVTRKGSIVYSLFFGGCYFVLYYLIAIFVSPPLLRIYNRFYNNKFGSAHLLFILGFMIFLLLVGLKANKLITNNQELRFYNDLLSYPLILYAVFINNYTNINTKNNILPK